MLSLIQHEVVEKHQWISDAQFTDIVAVSQMTPGPIGINSATYIGYTASGSVWGSVIATFSVCLPSFILMLFVSRIILKFKDNLWVDTIFSGLRPAIVGLVASAGLMLMNSQNFQDWKSFLIFGVVFIAVKFIKLHPILMIVISGAFGYFFCYPS